MTPHILFHNKRENEPLLLRRTIKRYSQRTWKWIKKRTTIRRAVRCGWQCIHLESTNNNRGFNYVWPVSRESFVFNFSVYIVWSFPFDCLLALLSCVLIFIVPIRRKSKSNVEIGGITNESRTTITKTTATTTNNDGEMKNLDTPLIAGSLHKYFCLLVPFCISFDLTIPYIDKICVQPTLRSWEWHQHHIRWCVSRPDKGNSLSFSLSLSPFSFFLSSFLAFKILKKNPFSWMKPDRYPCRFKRLFSLVFSY